MEGWEIWVPVDGKVAVERILVDGGRFDSQLMVEGFGSHLWVGEFGNSHLIAGGFCSQLRVGKYWVLTVDGWEIRLSVEGW